VPRYCYKRPTIALPITIFTKSMSIESKDSTKTAAPDAGKESEQQHINTVTDIADLAEFESKDTVLAGPGQPNEQRVIMCKEIMPILRQLAEQGTSSIDEACKLLEDEAFSDSTDKDRFYELMTARKYLLTTEKVPLEHFRDFAKWRQDKQKKMESTAADEIQGLETSGSDEK